MPIIGLFAGALFGGSGLVAVSAYFIGVAAIVISGIMLKKDVYKRQINRLSAEQAQTKATADE